MRDTWQQEIMDALGGAQSQAAQLRSLPNICVQASCFDNIHTVFAGQPTLNPRFPKTICRFENITLGNTISIKVRAGSAESTGTNTVACSVEGLMLLLVALLC